MPYATDSLGRYTRAQRLSRADVDVTTLLAQPEVADRVSSKLTKYYDKITGAAVDGYVSPIRPVDLLLQALGRAYRHPATSTRKSFKIDLSTDGAEVDVLPALVDLDQRTWLAGTDGLHQDLFRSLPKKLSRAERDLTESATVERLRGNIARRSLTSGSVGAGKTWVLIVDHVATDAHAELARLWSRLDIGRMLARHVKIVIRRILGLSMQRITRVVHVSTEVVRSIESHRSRAPGRSRTSVDLVRWEPLTI
ncbi:hypothetical protein C1A38_05370 [Verrucosispora sp. ts21]|uniref:hypothetical protein n=1 Tax=Verrucosispora sp. ts21 TaxID=2069341 RepID=UPI000C8882BD|nr:hypothetical protein [Verrucosispora sp. ts21]PMR62163.1 hypothetical protein C1A38_05370 [Verrucosispora sp. ts21]